MRVLSSPRAPPSSREVGAARVLYSPCKPPSPTTLPQTPLHLEVLLIACCAQQAGADAAHCLGYIYIRMLRNPELYGIHVKAREDDPELEQWRTNLLHTVSQHFEKSHLVKYNIKSGNF